MKRIAYISLWTALLAAACNTTSEGLTTTTSSIAALRNIETNNSSSLITQNITLEGQVTANDRYGEFASCIIVEDQSGAVKILCDLDDGYQTYPFGASVQIHCNGLYLLNHYGSLKLGAAPTGEYTLDYIASSDVGQYVKLMESSAEAPEPQEVTLDALTIFHIFCLVTLRDVTITNSDGLTTFCERDPDTSRTVDTSHTITDSQGNSATLFVESTCAYADQELPTSPTTIMAIVDYYDSQYSLTICNAGY